MNHLTTLQRTTNGWQLPTGEIVPTDSEGCLLIAPGTVISADGTQTAWGFEIYPNTQTETLYLYSHSTYVERLQDGRFYLLIENTEHISKDKDQLVTILKEWLAE